MWQRRRLKRKGPEFGPNAPAAEARVRARVAIAASLSGGDSTRAWNAVWDLVHSTDVEAKEDVLAMLREYVDNAVASQGASREATSYFGSPSGTSVDTAETKLDHQWNKIDLACDFEEAIQQSIAPRRTLTQASPEVRKMHQRDQLRAHEETLNKMGVRPGEGVPMWLMYMSRRDKRGWR